MAAVNSPMDLPPKLQRQGVASAATLTIARRTGHRRILHDIFVHNSSSGYAEIQVGNARMIRIYHNLAQAILLTDVTKRNANKGLMGYLADNIKDFPLFNGAQDEDVVITTSGSVTHLDAYFEDQQSGDVVKQDNPGGSKGKKLLFILNVSNAATMSTTIAGLELTSLDMPTGVTLFTDGKRISANNKFTIYAVAANVPITATSGVTRVHIWDEFTELFTSENNEGLFSDPNGKSELLFSLNPVNCFWLDEPYVFMPNKVMSIKVDYTDDGAHHPAANTQQVFLIGIREYVS